MKKGSGSPRTVVPGRRQVTLLMRTRGTWSQSERTKLKSLSGNVVYDSACPTCLVLTRKHDLTTIKRALGINGRNAIFRHEIVRGNHSGIPEQIRAVN